LKLKSGHRAKPFIPWRNIAPKFKPELHPNAEVLISKQKAST